MYSDFARLYREGLLDRWFTFLARTKFRNRGELGAYVIYPMLWFLQYPESDVHIDSPVAMLGATAGPTETVSCIVYGKTDVPLFLLDTISPTESLTTQIVDSVRLKAFSANVMKFAVTNGDVFILFNLLGGGLGGSGAHSRHFSLKNLKDHWLFVQSELHFSVFNY